MPPLPHLAALLSICATFNDGYQCIYFRLTHILSDDSSAGVVPPSMFVKIPYEVGWKVQILDTKL